MTFFIPIILFSYITARIEVPDADICWGVSWAHGPFQR